MHCVFQQFPGRGFTGVMDERIKAEATTAARQLLQRFRTAYLAWTDDYTPLDALVEPSARQRRTLSRSDGDPGGAPAGRQ